MENKYILICLCVLLILLIPKRNTTETFIYPDGSENYKKEILNKVVKNLYTLRDHLISSNPNDTYVINLQNNMTPSRTSIYETDPHTSKTSYTVNKGEEIHMCLRSKITGEIHNENILTYVGIHEMAHIANPEIGHGPLFQRIFNNFLKAAIEIGIYTPNFLNNSVEFCGKILINK